MRRVRRYVTIAVLAVLAVCASASGLVIVLATLMRAGLGDEDS